MNHPALSQRVVAAYKKFAAREQLVDLAVFALGASRSAPSLLLPSKVFCRKQLVPGASVALSREYTQIHAVALIHVGIYIYIYIYILSCTYVK